ncbi:glycoside hydrolase family 73 protein [Candidatus Enterococcus ferrettii]|uniref:Mannosyl-glycoprotein endo-beta-N-acetylglucosamidase-like domain-containing protein n=1 Tax=Candidatus Enterococcus ferrettii TaxID=2815324 RepID=A0ABV0ESB0_9ENTE|nr:glycoside hydrolase family 73 protein [Enterococcus sp. 665A]MBO1340797.1 glycoside hydrolase family 73 protein [Enterococcus sp. 665A]
MKAKHLFSSVAVLGMLVSIGNPGTVLAEEAMTSTTDELSSKSSATIERTVESTDSSTETTIESTESAQPKISEETTTDTEEIITEEPEDPSGQLTHTHPFPFEQFSMRAAQARSTNNQQVFINQVAPHAKTVAQANDLYASVMIAQAIVESGWGQSTLSKAPNYNLFGVKGNYNGQSVTMKTQEYVNGKWITVDAKFRKYPSFGESLNDNAYVLKNTSFQSGVYYYSGAWKSNTKTYKDATAWLTGRYATAPSYGATLNSVIEAYNLTQYDTPNSNNGGNAVNPVVEKTAMYRLYNPNSSEHFYTANTGEKDNLISVGWKYEGVAWQAPKKGAPVYRMYNPNVGDHHYTLNSAEKDMLVAKGWRYEGISWYSGGEIKLLRLYNPNAKAGSHHYTANTYEKDQLVKVGWQYEGHAWNGH